MNGDVPLVSVWAPLTGTTWGKVGEVAAYSNAKIQPRFLDAGTWDLETPYDESALAITKDRLLTFDWRGQRIMTGAIGIFNPTTDEETGALVLHVSGVDAFTILGRCLAWPDPTLGLGSQPASGLYSGPAETVLLDVLRANLKVRRGESIVVPGSAGRGAAITARTRFDPLSTIVAAKGAVGGVGVRVGLVDTSSTRADLTVSVFTPTDKSLRVRLSAKTGTLRTWSQTETEPTATTVIVGGAGDGAGRVFRNVTTPDSVAVAAEWGGAREVFVDGPDSFDNTELDQAGAEAITSGASTVNLSLTAAEADGLLAFRDYAPGDKATAELVTGLEVVDVISAIEVSVSDAGSDAGVTVTPSFGDPDADKPGLGMAQLVRGIRKQVRALEARR